MWFRNNLEASGSHCSNMSSFVISDRSNNGICGDRTGSLRPPHFAAYAHAMHLYFSVPLACI